MRIFIFLLLFSIRAYSADILIMKADKPTAKWEKGDIVDVFDTYKLSEYAHAGGKFFVLRITDVTKEQVQKYLEPKYDTENLDEDGYPTYVSKRKYKLRADDVPQAVKTAWQNNTIFVTTWTQIKNYVYNKITDTNE